MNNLFFLPFKNLRRKKLRSWLTIIGILIGITAVVSLITLGNGLKTAVLSQFDISSTEVLTVQAKGLSGYGAPGTGVTKPLTKDDVKAIEKLSVVEKAFARNIESVKIEYNDEVKFGMAISIPEEDRKLVYKIIGVEAEKGHLLKQGESNSVFLGHNYLDKTFKKEISPGKSILIQGKKFTVTGILKKKGSFLFDNIIAVGDDDLNDLIGYGDDVDIIVVKVKNKDLMNKAQEDIEKLMRKRRDVKVGEEDFDVQTPQSILKEINNILGGIQAFIIIIASISIIVGAVGIINTMTTSVLERTKEIGIMKAIGAKNSDIFLQFLVESGILGLIGGIIGVVFGLIIGYTGVLGINNFVGSSAKININLSLILLSLAGSFIIGAISGIVPAMNAAKQNPIEDLFIEKYLEKKIKKFFNYSFCFYRNCNYFYFY